MPVFVTIAVILSATTSTVKIAKWAQSGDMRRALSSFVEKRSRTPVIETDVARDAFTSTVLPPVNVVKGHTHAHAAGLRTSASAFTNTLALSIGTRTYCVEMSKADQRKGRAGCRQTYWSKDTNVANRNDRKLDADVVQITDVDYYMDMPAYLAENQNVVILYTVVPSVAAVAGEDDTSFYFTAKGELKTYVAGGGTYQHFLWDYSADSLIAKEYTLGFLTGLTTYAVERRQVGFSRQLILLAPLRSWSWGWSWLASWIVDGRTLERFDPVTTLKDGSKFIRFRVHDKDGTKVTTARPETHLCCTADASADAAVGTVARLGTTNLMLPTTTSWLGKDARQEAAVLTEFYRGSMGPVIPTVYPVEEGVRVYAFEPDHYEQSVKPRLTAFMSPLVHAAFAPAIDPASERQCVKGRVTNLKKPEPKHSNFVMVTMEEFVERLVGNTVLEPACVDTIVDRQTRPAQKLSLAKAMVHGPHLPNILKCFMKSEAYAGPKDPRMISMFNDADKLTMAQFILPLSDMLKEEPWYGPGKSPVAIAERVAEICSRALRANTSDYRRMDGTICALLRLLDRMIVMRAYPNHRAVLHELLKRNSGNKGYMPLGTSYDQGSAQASGCSATSFFQTCRAAYTAFLGFRRTICDATGTYMDADQAFAALGIHTGDDGLEADLPKENHLWAAQRVGLVLEAAEVHRGERGVNFLARYYSPEVWNGCTDSMCDVKRQLSKFHTTVRLPEGVTPCQKLDEKSRGYALTDGNTPVIGALCRRVVELSDVRRNAAAAGVGPWWSRFPAEVQFPNNNGNGWMDTEFEHLFPSFDRALFNRWLGGTRSLGDIIHAPLCAEIVPVSAGDVDVVVDGTLVLAASDFPGLRRTTCDASGTHTTEEEKHDPETLTTTEQPAAVVEPKKSKQPARSKAKSTKPKPIKMKVSKPSSQAKK